MALVTIGQKTVKVTVLPTVHPVPKQVRNAPRLVEPWEVEGSTWNVDPSEDLPTYDEWEFE